MELTNEFEVSAGVSETWAVLTEIERIAPCMPGAQLLEVDGDDYRGSIKVKVGPIVTEYHGTVRFLERDDAAHRAVLRAEGRETRGQGNASATVTATLEPLEQGTRVSVVTDLQISGKAAQFGRGVLADVSNKLIGQFVEDLESRVLGGEAPLGHVPHAPVPGIEQPADGHASEETEDSVSAKSAGPRLIESPTAEPVDLLEVAGGPTARRVLPVLGALVAISVIVGLLRRLWKQSAER
jgi:carbon monoxide dehydrogenase subunit G